MMKFLAIYSLFLSTFAATMTRAFVVPSRPFIARNNVALADKREALSDIDIMCIMNAADLCSYYDECDLDEREALLNRLDEQTDILSERISMMTCLVKHLQTGDHKHLEQAETDHLKAVILKTLETTPSVQESSAPVAP